MLVKDVLVGQVVQLGEVAAIKLLEKAGGGRVKMAFATELPVKVIADGIIPVRFTLGVTGKRRAHHGTLEDLAAAR